MTKLFAFFLFSLITFTLSAQTGDNCLDAIPIEAGSHSLISIEGDSYSLNCTEYDADNGNLKWYSYTSTSNYYITITSDLVANNGLDTRFHVYQGTCIDSSSGVNFEGECIGGDDDSGEGYLSIGSFYSYPGETYYIAWDNHWQNNDFIFDLIESDPPPPIVEASGYGFNFFERLWVDVNEMGAGYSFYAAAWPVMQQYPGDENFQLGLPSTWLTPLPTGNEPAGFYNTIEGGLGWWHDTRFATETPKFIMGGVANGFSQWANGVGAGSSAMLSDGHRDWSTPSGKYGVAQLSNRLLWPPDGLNMEQGANGELLGYGYHPLPLTDVMQTTNGVDFMTGNQCWTLFLNTTNFKGPAAFFIPTFWTETALDDSNLEGLFLDQRPSDKNQAFAIEYAESPALISFDEEDAYARILPLAFPASTTNQSELIREIKVYTKEAMWNGVENWFNGGAVPSTQFQSDGTEAIVFIVNSDVDGHIVTNIGNPIDAPIDMNGFSTKISTDNQSSAGIEWDTNIVDQVNGTFVIPEYYKLDENNQWQPIVQDQIPPSTGLLDNTPTITPRNETSYLTPKEPDCHLQDPQSPWNNPGPSAGPFTIALGDGSMLTYYWYKFIDQPSIIHANLSASIRQNLQERVELIQTNWLHTDNYLPNLNSGTLVGLDPGLLVTPPDGLEIGYVPIVTRQELDNTLDIVDFLNEDEIIIFPNPSKGIINIESKEPLDGYIRIFDIMGNLLLVKRINGLNNQLSLSVADGFYIIQLDTKTGLITKKVILKK
jgi:hypothetical protein